jgi:hypothetical protein
MKYSKMAAIKPGIKFKSHSGISVETTGVTVHVESTDVYVHEVTVTEGAGKGNKYLHNLDAAQALSH